MKRLHNRAAGFSLIEVMIAVVVLAIGLVSLAALQGRLFQSGAESKARAAATALAQQVLEEARSFAFVTPPPSDPASPYTGMTYAGLETVAPETVSSGGVDFTVSRTVTRYRYSATANSGAGGFVLNNTDPYSVGVPEFKKVSIDVSWSGSDGAGKSVKLTDSIAAVAPADAARLRRQPGDPIIGPKVYIARPDDPQILPIALGDGQEAASSNPKPNQVIENVAAATTFSVMTYSGSGDSVLLGRKVDVAAASCLCQAGSNASASNPTYQPVVWSGRQQAYLEPLALTDASIRTGIPDSKLNNSEIKQMCTVCCRDHREAVRRSPRPDPWRALTDAEKPPTGEEHYGYASKGNNFDLARLLGFGTSGVGSYVDSCQLIRVGGRLRLAVDANQANLLVTPLSGNERAPYDVVNFKDSYGAFVRNQIESNIDRVTGGEFPSFEVPAYPDSDLRVGPISMGNASPEKKLVAFGMYMDYLSQDTLDTYDCVARTIQSNEPKCKGLRAAGPQAAMALLPFYAVNVANLGEWRSARPPAIMAYSADYSQGTDGGRARPNVGAASDLIPVTLRMNASNTGLASTFPVDPDDAKSGSFREDHQDFQRIGGDPDIKTYTIGFRVVLSDGVNLSRYNFGGVKMPGTGVGVECDGRFSVSCTVTYKGDPPQSIKVDVSGYNTVDSAGTIVNRMVCVPAPDAAGNAATLSVAGENTLGETTTLTVPGNYKQNGFIDLAIVLQANGCPSSFKSL